MPNAPAEVVIWTDTARAARDGLIVDAMAGRIRVTAVGGPRTAEVDSLAKRLDCPHFDDLRKMLVDVPTPWLLLGSQIDARPRDIQTAVDAGTQVLALDPLTVQPDAGRGCVWHIPSFLRTEGWTSAAEPMSVLEAAQVVSITSLGRPADCTLFARLADAWRVVLQLGQLPLTIDASLSGALAAPPEDVKGLAGHLGALARLPDGATVLMQVSDRAGVHMRRLEVIGRAGRLHAGDLDYRLFDADGNLMDHREAGNEQVDFVTRAAADFTRLLTGMDKAALSAEKEDRNAQLQRDVLACCQTCLLSARTGEPERPERMLQIR